MRLPSGLQAGAESVACAVVNRRGEPCPEPVEGPPLVLTSQRLAVLLFLSNDHSCTVNTAVLPSGERAGDPSRFMAHRSCEVIGRLSAAELENATGNARAQPMRKGSGECMPAHLRKANALGEVFPSIRSHHPICVIWVICGQLFFAAWGTTIW